MREVISINIGQAGIQSGKCSFFRMDESDEWQLVFSTRIIITQHSSKPSAARKAPHKQAETIVVFTWTAFFSLPLLFVSPAGCPQRAGNSHLKQPRPCAAPARDESAG